MGLDQGHVIGEPVSVSPSVLLSKPAFTFNSGDNTWRMMKIIIMRSLKIFGIMILFTIILTLPMALVAGPILMIMMLFIFILIFPVSFVLALLLVFFIRSRSKRNTVELHSEHLLITSQYSDYFPKVTVMIPYHQITSMEEDGDKIWKQQMKDTPAHFKFLMSNPYPPDEALFSHISRQEDIVTLNLRTPITIEKMMPPKGFIDRASTKKFRVDRVMVDVESNSHEEFIRKMQEMGAGHW